MKPRTRGLVLLLSTPILAYAVLGGYLGRTFAQEDGYRPLRIFEDVVTLIMGSYVEEVDIDEVMHGAMRGLSAGLDADSSYLTPAEVAALEQDAPAPEGDVGLSLTRQYYLRVVSARDASPAAQAGLRPGDYLRAIDGTSTRDMSILEGARLLRGDVGSAVTLNVIRGNAAEPQPIELMRTGLEAPAVTSRVAAPGIGYVRIVAFENGAADEVDVAVESLRRAGGARAGDRPPGYGGRQLRGRGSRLRVCSSTPAPWPSASNGRPSRRRRSPSRATARSIYLSSC